MPYIESQDRSKFSLDTLLGNINHNGITPGELNYLVTRLAMAYIDHKGLNYTHINDVLGALEGSKQEFYRRVAVDYERKKIVENGDVYPVTVTPKYPSTKEFNGS
jgi:hypothetical protein